MYKRFLIPFLIALFALLALLPAAAQDEESPFPVTIEHKYGTTTIAEAPERVVTIGYTEQDYLLALGITPVAVRYWYGDETNAIFPWAEDYVEGDTPVVLNMPYGNLNYEAILELEPDLISAVTSGITEEEYELLSQIAPTIAQSGDYIDFGMPWQEITRLIGEAVGKADEAETIVEDVETLFDDTRAEYPEFEESTIAVVYSFTAGTYGFYTPEDARGRFFTDLGFMFPDELAEVAGEAFYTDISTERIDLLDQDLIAFVNLQFVEGGREALEEDPLFSQLQAVQDGRVLYLTPDEEDALQFSSPLSLPFALEGVLTTLDTMMGEEEDTAG